MTNIIRDVGKDLQNGRIYLPQEDLVRFHYSETELAQRLYDRAFRPTDGIPGEARASFFANAAAALPTEDRRPCAPAEIMSSVYRGLLRRIELDNFSHF